MMEIKEVKDTAAAVKAAKLADSIWHEHYADILGSAQIDYMLEKFQSVKAIEAQMREGMQYYLVRDDGMCVGYFAIEPQGKRMFVSKLYLIKEARGHGFGRSCVRFIEEQAADRGLRTLRLTVNKHNAGSVAVYEKLGFTVAGEGTVDIGGGYVMDDYYMEKPVDIR